VVVLPRSPANAAVLADSIADLESQRGFGRGYVSPEAEKEYNFVDEKGVSGLIKSIWEHGPA
jgi:hypothetical protein